MGFLQAEWDPSKAELDYTQVWESLPIHRMGGTFVKSGA
jgi:hypothetical protein